LRHSGSAISICIRLADPEELEKIGFFDEPEKRLLRLRIGPFRAGDMLPEHH